MTYIEKENSKITYGREDLKRILISELEEKFISDGIDKLDVINKIVNIYDKTNEIIEIEMTYEVIENIGEEEEIQLSE